MPYLKSILSVFIGVLCLPTLAYAWGPVTHLSFGLEILDKLPMLIPSLQELFMRFRMDYLYGCMAADITIKKDGIPYEHNCHNWDIGLYILKQARSPKQKAFAYGYLSHLAADTISHNYYVPYQTIAAFPTKTLKHLYWEMRLDTLQNPAIWTLAKKIVKKYHGSIHDKLLEKSLKRTLFSFRTNKFIFNSLVSSLPSYKVLSQVFKKSSWELPEKDIAEYRSLATQAIIDFLNFKKDSKFYLIDPSGKLALQKAKQLKKELKRLYKHEDSKNTQQKLSVIKKDLKEALFQKTYHQKWTAYQ